jgi:hypothetical protein
MRNRQAIVRAVAVAATIPSSLTVACGSDVPDGTVPISSIHSDSAGVDVVLNLIDAADVPVFASMDSAPSLRLGTLGGRREEQFGSITDVLPLSDGGVAVLDGQAAEIRIFDASGMYRSTLGSKGDGPGELRLPWALGRIGDDTIAVFDRRTKRITRFALGGGLGGMTKLATEGRRPINRAFFLPDGWLVGQSPWTADITGRFVPPPQGDYTFVRDSAVLMVYTPTGGIQDSLGVFPNSENIWRMEVSGGSISLFKRAAVFGRTLVFQGHPDGVWSGYNERFELELRDAADGHLKRVVRAPGLERAATDGMAARIRDYVVEDGEQSPERVRTLKEWFKVSPQPDRLPAYDRIVVDDQARLWVREWSGTGPSRNWWIFTEAGELLGSVQVPQGATLYAVLCGSAWGVLTDELDVGYVVRYALNGPVMEPGQCGGVGG